MKFDKFGAFPKSDGIKAQDSKNNNFANLLLKLLPNLFSKQNTSDSPQKNAEKVEMVESKISADTLAYREYLARHDAFVKQSKENKKTP